MDENQPMQTNQPAPETGEKSKAGMWVVVLLVVIIIAVVVWLLVK